MNALRISPLYTSLDWQALDSTNSRDWPKAADIIRDRLEGRFLRFASNWLKKDKNSGFVVLAIDCLVAETIQQFKDGVTNGHGRSREMIKRLLAGTRFQPDFNAKARERFYDDIRCGLLHQAEAKRMWLIRRKQPALLQKTADGKGYIIDVERFHASLQDSLNDYLKLIPEPTSSSARSNLWKKMNQICTARTARGALYEAEGNTASSQ